MADEPNDTVKRVALLERAIIEIADGLIACEGVSPVVYMDERSEEAKAVREILSRK